MILKGKAAADYLRTRPPSRGAAGSGERSQRAPQYGDQDYKPPVGMWVFGAFGVFMCLLAAVVYRIQGNEPLSEFYVFLACFPGFGTVCAWLSELLQAD